MKFSHARFSLQDDVLTILYVTLFETVLKSEGYSLKGYSGADQHLLNPKQRISPNKYYNILEQSLKQTAPTGLGFRYGKLLDIAAADTVGQLLLSSKNLEEAIEGFLNFFPLLSLSTQFETSWHDDIFTVEADRIYNKTVSKQTQWFLTESLFYCWLTQARLLTGKPMHYQHASFKYSKPPHWRMYETLLGCNVTFDAPNDSISLHKEHVKSKVISANETVHKLKERQCNKVLHQWQSRFSISEQINTTLNQTLPNIPSLEQMAEQLNLSRSSLYRRLRDSDNSYQSIVDNFRRDKAVQLLGDSQLTIGQIAENLGFSDASNFRRAFKKWTGYKPSDLRSGKIPEGFPLKYFRLIGKTPTQPS